MNSISMTLSPATSARVGSDDVSVLERGDESALATTRLR